MNRPQAPEILQIPLSDVDVSALPSGARERGTPAFEEAVIAHHALTYAARGWNAVVTVDEDFIRVVAVPQDGIDPKAYVLGLLQNGFLEDALPLLDALDGMVDDADIAYNRGICLSELGRFAEAVEPLQRCLRLDPDHTHAWVGLGVALTRLGRHDEAEQALRTAFIRTPGTFSRRAISPRYWRGPARVKRRCRIFARRRISLPTTPASRSGSPSASNNSVGIASARPTGSTPTSPVASPTIPWPRSPARPAPASPRRTFGPPSTAICAWTP